MKICALCSLKSNETTEASDISARLITLLNLNISELYVEGPYSVNDDAIKAIAQKNAGVLFAQIENRQKHIWPTQPLFSFEQKPSR